MAEVKICEKVDICPECEQFCTIETIREEYDTDLFGETHRVQSEFFRCKRCGAEFFDGEQLNKTIVDGKIFYKERKE